MKKLPPTTTLASLSVTTSDSTTTTDGIGTTKPWFNGAKFFHMVKVLPKKD